MIKTFAIASLVLTTLSGAALAVNVTPPSSATATPAAAAPVSDSAALNSLVPMAGDAKPANGKVDYETLTRAEKLKMINERHTASVKKAEAKWKSLSDDEKLAKFEKRRNSFLARRAAKAQQQNASAATPVQTLAPAAGTTTAATTPATKATTVKQ